MVVSNYAEPNLRTTLERTKFCSGVQSYTGLAIPFDEIDLRKLVVLKLFSFRASYDVLVYSCTCFIPSSQNSNQDAVKIIKNVSDFEFILFQILLFWLIVFNVLRGKFVFFFFIITAIHK